MFISEYLQKDVASLGIFDALLDKDSNFFINIIRLKESAVPEFREAYSHVNSYFSGIATLLNAADKADKSDRMYREARRRFAFHEVNGINLGFSKSSYGAGWGDTISDKVLSDAFQIVKKGSSQPEIFHLVNLFEENIAGDRLSDMLASVIEEDIKAYTKRMLNEMGVSAVSFPQLDWTKEGLIKNPYKKCPILLLPVDVLHELPIARDWYDLGDVITKNEAIRREISSEIGLEWEKWASRTRKQYLYDNIFMNPEVCKRVIEGYREEDLAAIDPREYPEYMAELLLKQIRTVMPFAAKKREPSSFEAAMAIIGILKDWVENNKGWAVIQNIPKQIREKAVQCCMFLGAKYYIDKNNIDLSPESNSGRGPVDFKLSRGNDKTVVEVKLSSNGNYIHGYHAQVEEYGRAERTRNLVYVFVDVGNPGRLETIKTEHWNNRDAGIPCPELVIIDATEKKSASKLKDDFAWDIPEFDYDDPVLGL